MLSKEFKTHENKSSISEWNYKNFFPHPGHVLIETDIEVIQKLYGVVMPQEQNNDTRVKGIIVRKTNSSNEKATQLNDHYSIGDTVFFKKWSGVEIYETSHFKYLEVKMEELHGFYDFEAKEAN